MKLSSRVSAAAYKRLATVDLPNKTSHQHELSGVNALKSFFGGTATTQAQILWAFAHPGSEISTSESQCTFYDARAKSASRTGRSEWRLYYHGNFLSLANPGDILILLKTWDSRILGLVIDQQSEFYEDARSIFGATDKSSSFEYLSQSELNSRQLPSSLDSPLVKWIEEHCPSIEETKNLSSTELLPFRPRARILILLGDQLIRDAGIAVFELAKNAYDADARKVAITLHHVTDRDRGSVIVEDDGCGMSADDILNIWLEPGTDHRQKQKTSGYRTPLFHRLPLGEKGVGRFAAHKIGKRIRLISKKLLHQEVIVDIDWNIFESQKYLSDATVSVSERPPQHFLEKTGTRLEISELNEELSRGTIRQISRSITSICSPFRGPEEFSADLEVIPDNNTLEGLLDISHVLEAAPYSATCWIENGVLSYEYHFLPPSQMERIVGRSVHKEIEIPESKPLSAAQLGHAVGAILIDFRIFDLDSQIMDYSVTDKRGFRNFLKQNGGIRVYRDGVRVYDYGEPGNDWLDLGGSRVNSPSAKISNNQVIAAVHLDGAFSSKLVEKTNREGFIEDETYQSFVKTIQFALTQVVFERNVDKGRLRQVYSTRKFKQPVIDELAELRLCVSKFPEVAVELSPIVDRVENQYLQVREILLTAAGSGLTLSVVIHEVEKSIRGLSRAISSNAPISELKDLADHVDELIEGLTYLTKKSGRENEAASNLIRQAIANTNFRLKTHKIEIVNGLAHGDPDFQIRCTRRLIIATIMNLIDNSIYWLGTKGQDYQVIHIGTNTDVVGKPMIFIADSGPGFQDDPNDLIQPFISRRPEGMGLGLHIADSVMRAHEGKIVFPTKEDLGLDSKFSGAIVGLQFNE